MDMYRVKPLVFHIITRIFKLNIDDLTVASRY
jgi:hypothetical protein